MRRTGWDSWGPCLSLAGVLALSLGATLAALGALNVAPLYREEAGTPQAAFTPRRPVLLLVLDGLREDTARSLPTLQRLAQRGASARVLAEFPTFSAPAYVALLTGVSPLSSGRRTNHGLFGTGLDSVPGQLSRRGRTARALSDAVDWWGTLLPGAFSRVEVLDREPLLARAEQWMADSDLLVVHLCGVDDAGHDHGASSAEYDAAARRAEEAVARLAERWGDRGVLSVVSDHGHVPAGGHGGTEDAVRRTWWIAAGPGVAAHADALRPVADLTTTGLPATDLPVTDVAPTLAAWLGVPPPAQAEGTTAVGMVDAPSPARERLRAQDAERHARLEQAREVAQQALRGERERAQRGRALLVAGLALAVGWALRRSPGARGMGSFGVGSFGVGALVGGLALALTAGLFFLVWGPLSFSAASGPGFIAVRSALLFLAGAAVLLAWALRRERDPVRRRCLLLGTALVAALPAAVLFVLEGAFSARPLLPSPTLAVLPLQVWPVAGAGALLALGCWAFVGRPATARQGLPDPAAAGSSDAFGSPGTNGTPRSAR